MKEPVVAKILRMSLYLTFCVGVVLTLSIPFFIEWYTYLVQGTGHITAGYRQFIVPFLMGSAIPCLWIVLEMIGMLATIKQDPFVKRNTRALNRVGSLFLLLSVVFFLKCVVFFTVLTLFCAFLFLGAGLFAFTLSALIGQSIAIKEENDLTI